MNDLAWGKGFTEWDNVKSGKPLYKNHYQPIKPLNNHYYDLSQKNDIEQQIDIANQYGVDGFIFYHYWFENDKSAFTIPVQLLKNTIHKKIDYCFCWANHSWIKNWVGCHHEIIVKQEYGQEKEWIDHIVYLFPFFEDSRYIKIGNRPMFYVYNMSDIPNFEKMLQVWNRYLKKHNMGNLYVVEFISSKNKKRNCMKSDAVVEFEPLYTTYFDLTKFNLLKRFIAKKCNRIDYQDYNQLWNKIIHRTRTYGDCVIQKGCFCGWDNSARKGYNCMIVKNSNPENFGINLRKLLNNNRTKATNDFVVINAWNEWSEGAMLEPNSKYGYQYLEEIQKIKKDMNIF